MKSMPYKSRELYSGVFWINDPDNPAEEYCFKIPTDEHGNINANTEYKLNAKSGNTYNHERLWKELPGSITHNKPYNYYPRGRVQISNNKAVVYMNPGINTELIQKFIMDNYNLTEDNGIKKIIFNSDGSGHYKCHFDD